MNGQASASTPLWNPQTRIQRKYAALMNEIPTGKIVPHIQQRSCLNKSPVTPLYIVLTLQSWPSSQQTELKTTTRVEESSWNQPNCGARAAPAPYTMAGFFEIPISCPALLDTRPDSLSSSSQRAHSSAQGHLKRNNPFHPNNTRLILYFAFNESKALAVDCNKSAPLFYQVQKSWVMQINTNPRDFPVDFKCLKNFKDTRTKTTEQSVNLLEERDSLSSHTGTALYPVQKPWTDCAEHCSDCLTVLFKPHVDFPNKSRKRQKRENAKTRLRPNKRELFHQGYNL